MNKFPCPECGGKVEYYNTAKDRKSGKYRCLKCGRDTVWKEGKAYTIFEIMNKISKSIGE